MSSVAKGGLRERDGGNTGTVEDNDNAAGWIRGCIIEVHGQRIAALVTDDLEVEL